MVDRRQVTCRRLAAKHVRPLLVEADRLWFLEEFFFECYGEPRDVRALPPRRSSDLRMACRRLAAAVVRLLLAAAARLWFLEGLFSALAPEPPVVSAKE